LNLIANSYFIQERRVFRGIFVCFFALLCADRPTLGQPDKTQPSAVASAIDAEYRRFEEVSSFVRARNARDYAFSAAKGIDEPLTTEELLSWQASIDRHGLAVDPGAVVSCETHDAFEGAIKRGGKGIQASLAAFTAGFEATTAGYPNRAADRSSPGYGRAAPASYQMPAASVAGYEPATGGYSMPSLSADAIGSYPVTAEPPDSGMSTTSQRPSSSTRPPPLRLAMRKLPCGRSRTRRYGGSASSKPRRAMRCAASSRQSATSSTQRFVRGPSTVVSVIGMCISDMQSDGPCAFSLHSLFAS